MLAARLLLGAGLSFATANCRSTKEDASDGAGASDESEDGVDRPITKVIHDRPEFVDAPASIVALVRTLPKETWGARRRQKKRKLPPCPDSFYAGLEEAPELAWCAGLVVARNMVLTPRHCLDYAAASDHTVLSDYENHIVSSSGSPSEHAKYGVDRSCYEGVGSGLNDWVVLHTTRMFDASEVFDGAARGSDPNTKANAYHFPLGVPVMTNEVEICDAEDDAGLTTPVVRTVCSSENHSSGAFLFVGEGEEEYLAGMHVSLRQGLGTSVVEMPTCYAEKDCGSTCESAAPGCPHGQMIPGEILSEILALADTGCPEATAEYVYDSHAHGLKPRPSR